MQPERSLVRVGSRKSELALIQTNYVIDCLQKVYPDIKFSIVTMTTLGDRILNVSLPKIGEKSLFTKDLEDALIKGTVDFVVHSLKDLPTTLPDGLTIGAVFEREDPRDALVLREDFKGHTLATLPPASCVGTSSLRRTAQLRAMHPHLRVVDVRGNLNTRLKKLEHRAADGSEDQKGQEYAALILAQAGLERMGWHDRISQVLPCSEMLYAVGQGALAVECRSDNTDLLAMLSMFNHPETYCRILVERSFLKTLGGGCSAPVGVSTSLKPNNDVHKLTISGAVWSLDGTIKVHHKLDHIFKQIHKSELASSSKHKLSPTEENELKKIKVTQNDVKNNEIDIHGTNLIDNSQNTEIIDETDDLNPIEEYNRKITEQHKMSKGLGCEDLRSDGEAARSDAEVAALTKNVNLNEVDNSLTDNLNNGSATGSDNGQNVNLKSGIFCGLSENKNVRKEVIEKCENLGKELANILISKGALDVMKTAQEFIRSSVNKT